MNKKLKIIFAVGILCVIQHCSNSSDSTTPGPATPSTSSTQICEPSSELECNDLAGIWSDGTAVCKSDGLSYDVSKCVRGGVSSRNLTETVYPAKRDDRWKNAKCSHANDFVFEISIPPNPSGVWEITLEGGGFCAFDGTMGGDGDGSCSRRERMYVDPYKTNNLPYPADRSITVVTPNSDPDFGNAIEVSAHYCSNDLWTGANTSGIPVYWKQDGSYHNWKFTGHLNVLAMLDILQQRYGLDDNNPNLQIFFRGGSAGGWGVMNNAHVVKSRFSKTAAKGNLMLYAGAGFIPLTWSNPDFPTFGIVDAELGPLTSMDAFGIAVGNWKSVLMPKCLADHQDLPQSCISGDTLYEYITGSEASGNLDLPLMVYGNRQDQLYMDLVQLNAVVDPQPSDQKKARNDFIDQMNVAMGITGVDSSNKIKWLYAPSDPVLSSHVIAEPNVHGPLCYLGDSPKGPNFSVNALMSRFWNTRGQGPGRGQASGEVITFDENFVTTATGDCQ